MIHTISLPITEVTALRSYKIPAAENAAKDGSDHTNKPLRLLMFALGLSSCLSSVHFD